jgi:hypothetical protein
VVIPAGKRYKGVDIRQVDNGYLEWILRDRAFSMCFSPADHAAFLLHVRNELQRRKEAEADFAQEQQRESARQAYQHEWREGTWDDHAASNIRYKCSRCSDTGKVGMTQFCMECVKGLTLYAADQQRTAVETIRKLQNELSIARQTPPPASQRASANVTKSVCTRLIAFVRKRVGSVYHPDVCKDPNMIEEGKDLNAALDWFEKCVSTLPR